MEINSQVPSINIDIIEPTENGEYTFNNNKNFQEIVTSQNKVVLFAVPGIIYDEMI